VIYISHDVILQVSEVCDARNIYMRKPALPKTKKKADTSISTKESLIQAADNEFRQHGFAGTDSNKIARCAGFAPQTFYRWFGSKTEIFLAVYLAWENQETTALNALIAEKASTRRIAETIIKHHRDYLVFRRSLRQLSVEDSEVRSARAQSRLRQIAQIEAWANAGITQRPQLAATLLQIERLADAAAEGEFSDLGISETAATAALSSLINKLRDN
jgi:AcrR family transcriptional regulator